MEGKVLACILIRIKEKTTHGKIANNLRGKAEYASVVFIFIVCLFLYSTHLYFLARYLFSDLIRRWVYKKEAVSESE